MSQTRYYRVTAKIRKEIEEIHERQLAAFRARERIARRLGASRGKTAIAQFAGSLWGIRDFRKDVVESGRLEKLWRFDKKKGCWVPKQRPKAAKEIHDQMYCDETRIPDGWDIAKVLKLDPMQSLGPVRGGGLGFALPGLQHFTTAKGKDVWIVKYAGKEEPHGCTRISDLQYEKLKSKQ